MDAYLEDEFGASKWKATSEEMDEKDFRENIEKVMVEFEKQAIAGKIINVLDDSSEMKFALHPDLQSWAINKVVPFYMKYKIKKYAMVLPQEFISHLAYEQIAEESVNLPDKLPYRSKVFNDLEKAKAWLKE